MYTMPMLLCAMLMLALPELRLLVECRI
ncbi:hypothetical protein EYZ11_012422 [Aspergillus tanneri]|uniref:Uncharacterized protein n=1 Tax=Aspergillus tanneri TaxID=1220188 RepID=A0A4V3UMP8_9EURO|nr:hypothetical protein EYZ11_012422 [Aspergillus tanneri]